MDEPDEVFPHCIHCDHEVGVTHEDPCEDDPGCPGAVPITP